MSNISIMMTFRIWQFLMVCIPMLYITSAAMAVQYPPTIIKRPPHEQLYIVPENQNEPDKPFILECEADGNPEPVYRWKKNGQPFDYESYNKRIFKLPRRGTLIFAKTDDVDEGLYQCFAENIHGISVSNSVFVRKSELIPFPDIGKKIIEVTEGELLTLQCNPPTGYPKPTIFWVKLSNNGALNAIKSSRLTVDPEGNLHFSNVTQEDSLKFHYYACSATSVFNNAYRLGNIISLDVKNISGQASHVPMRQYTSPPNVVGLRGQTVTLTCIYGGTPMPQIVWRKKDGSLNSPRYQYEQYGRTLKISPVTYDDEATYKCIASNGQGYPRSHTMTVTVQAAPYWIESPNNTNAGEGESVKFKCHADGIPEPKLQWYINGKPIDTIPNPRRKVQGNVLYIENLAKSDTASYQCNASNIHGYAFHDFYLNILALPPTITEPPEPLVKAVVSSTVILRCKVFGMPHPDVKWIKAEQELTEGRYQIIDYGNLEIKNVSHTDQGEYTCYAINKFGKAKEHGRLEVKDKTKIIQPPENSEVAVGKSITFKCNVEADPTLTLQIIWLFNDQPIDFDQAPRMVKMHDNSLIITRTTELDSGIYVCLAKTELDSDNATATLTVQDVPNPPRITGIKCNGLSVVLEWQPMGDRRAPILNYTIQYNTSFTPDSWINAFETVPASNTQLTLSMSPWANYTFRVIASNKIGPSLPSAPSSKCTTPPDVPYKNPDKVEGYGTEPNNLIISWSAMPPIDHNAPGFYYRVYWKRNDLIDATWEYEEIRNWKQNQHLLYNQPTFKPYRIKVRAYNQIGQSTVMPAEIIGYSGEDVPEEAPKNFHLVYIKDARSALMAWDHVPKHSIRGHFKGYKIQAWTSEEDEEHMREQIVGPEKNESLINILRPNSNNKIVIFVFNERYAGPRSEVIQFYTSKEEHELPLESSSNLDNPIENNTESVKEINKNDNEESEEIDTDANILKSPENKTEINEAFMINFMNAFKNNSTITPINKYQATGINVAVKLEKMNSTQRFYAEELINKILFKGLNGRLTAETDIVEIS